MAVTEQIEIQDGPSQAALLLALTTLYMSFGAVLGLIQGGLPPMLMAAGMGPGAAGLAYGFYMPFGLAFLWAAWVDRWDIPVLSRFGARRGWIIATQALTILSVVAVAFVPSNAIGALISLGFLAAFSMATMDLALDGLAVERISKKSRSWAAGLKLAALASGSMFGGGLLVARFEVWGRETSFLVLATLLAVLLIPVLLLTLPEVPKQQGRAKASLIHLFKQPESRRRLIRLIVICAIIFPASGLNRLMLVAIGVPLNEIGWVVGTLGPLGMIVASALAIPLMNKLGHRRSLLIFGAISLVAICLMLWGVVSGSVLPAMTGAVVIGGAVGGIFVIYAAMILGWAKGAQPVTDYAAYYGIGRFIAAVAMLLSAQLAKYIDWTWYFAVLVVLFALLMLHFNRKVDT
ncbi:MFS transporter [Celeribacter sp. ULVN23_4]